MNEKISTISDPILNPALPATDQINPEIAATLEAQSTALTGPPPLRARRIEIKARCGSFLQRITEEQRRQLFLWLGGEHSIPHIQSLIAEPPPAGFGLNVQATTLRRIRATMRTFHHEDAYQDSAFVADALSETIEQNPVDFAPVISDLLSKRHSISLGTITPLQTSRRSSPASSGFANSS